MSKRPLNESKPSEKTKLSSKVQHTVFTLEVIHDEVVESVREDILERSKKGQAEYGTTMDRDDLSLLEWHQHLYEEQLDTVIYTKKIITMLKSKLNK